jgi:hypothetical protein
VHKKGYYPIKLIGVLGHGGDSGLGMKRKKKAI